tara:strand:+ start:430 stop:567 length:138 start_codon:yes stop_codon:yes gene_type:complete
MNSNEVLYEELYKDFQEWLSKCPLRITDYNDNFTDFAIDFSMEVD